MTLKLFILPVLAKPFPVISGHRFIISHPDWPILACHRKDQNPKSQRRDFVAAVAAEGECLADIDELANLFSRQNLEWGTGFVC